MPVERWGVEVEGLDELRRMFRQAGDKVSAKGLGQAGKSAADIVAKKAQTKVPVRTGRAKSSVRAVALTGGGAIRGGGAKVPYYGFLDFGNKIKSGAGVGRGDTQPRPFIARGRFIYPSLDEEFDRVIDTYQTMLVNLMRAAGLTVES